MAERKFSELPSAASLTGNELAALSQMQSGSLASVKTTLQAIANWFAVYAQYTTALQTTDKTIAGAINELKQLISLIPQFSIEVVEELPTEDISDTTIYLVPAENPEVGNYYEEYIHVNNTWELVGTTAVDLSAYYTKLEVDGLLANKASVTEVALKENKSDMPTDVRTIIKDCKTPKSATITNGIAQFECIEENLVKGLKVAMSPIQDLHGYDHPWAGGAGKNLLKITNTTGTTKGLTFTVNDDGSVTITGTTTGTNVFFNLNYVLNENNVPLDTYLNTGYASQNASGNVNLQVGANTILTKGEYHSSDRFGMSSNFIIADTGNIPSTWLRFQVQDSGVTINETLYPFMCLSSNKMTAFEPYSNICPISGRTEASVNRTGKNLVKTVDWGENQYKCQRYGVNGGSPKLSFNGKLKSGTYTLSLLFKNLGNVAEGSKQGLIRLWVVKNNTVYSFNTSTGEMSPTTAGGTFIFEYNANLPANNTRISSYPFKIAEDIDEIRMGLYQTGGKYVEIDEIQIELGSSGSAYEPYQGETHTHQYGQTVYGGEDDFVEGGLTNTHYMYEPTEVAQASVSSQTDTVVVFDLTLSMNNLPTPKANTLISNRFSMSIPSGQAGRCVLSATHMYLVVAKSELNTYDRAGLNEWITNNPTQLCYELATPTAIETSAEEITTVAGTNIISGTEPISECKYTELATVDDLRKIIGGQ